MYVYLTSIGPGRTFYTVGFYKPDETWESDSDHNEREDAAARVHWLNGGNPITTDLIADRVCGVR